MKAELLTHIKGQGTEDRQVQNEATSVTLKQDDSRAKIVHWTVPEEQQTEVVLIGPEGSEETVQISKEMEPEERDQLVGLLKEYHDVFAWKYTQMKGIPTQVGLHKILLEPDATPVQSQRYRMNPNYTKIVKVRFISSSTQDS